MLHLTEPDGKPLDDRGRDARRSSCCTSAAGYGGDPDWSHGQWRAATAPRAQVYDLTDPHRRPRIPFGVIDHVGRATCDGQEGWGLFEHGTFGRHDPSGFADWGSVA